MYAGQGSPAILVGEKQRLAKGSAYNDSYGEGGISTDGRDSHDDRLLSKKTAGRELLPPPGPSLHTQSGMRHPKEGCPAWRASR